MVAHFHRNIQSENFFDEGGLDNGLHSETQVGYYHIRANDIQEAIKIAKNNPEFEYVPSATIEVRPIKTKEVETGFVYPTNK